MSGFGGVDAFVAYSHRDEALKDALIAHLAGMEHAGLVRIWHDRKILAGQEWESEIRSELNSVDLIVLLVSSDFLSSGYCVGVEARRAMERHANGDALVVPVVLRPCVWRHFPFSILQALPKDATAVTAWPNQDQALANVAEGIEASLGDWLGRAPRDRASPRLGELLSSGRLPGETTLMPGLSHRDGEIGQLLPVVGVAGVSQTGPIPPDPDGQRATTLPREAGRLLAFYSGLGRLLLAPRGWDGATWYGSSGMSIKLRPQLEAFVPTSQEFVTEIYKTGSTSGRSFVQEFGPVLFPGRVASRRELAGTFPGAIIQPLAENLVIFDDPAGQRGIGAAMADEDAAECRAYGCAVLVSTPHDTPDLNVLTVRLSEFHESLAPLIRREFLRSRLVAPPVPSGE